MLHAVGERRERAVLQSALAKSRIKKENHPFDNEECRGGEIGRCPTYREFLPQPDDGRVASPPIRPPHCYPIGFTTATGELPLSARAKENVPCGWWQRFIYWSSDFNPNLA
jgi:hypothetical protein